MRKIECDHCGHANPFGTILCESCGKPLTQKEKESDQVLSMRYEGGARRSQVYQKTWIDKIWNTFSSVKVGVLLIVLVIIASAIGTILPQEMYIPPNANPAQYYEEQYGFFGKLYYTLGFHQLYGSWWFVVLLALLGTSIIISSVDRAIPLYRSLKNQRVTRHETFLKRQRIFGVTKVKAAQETEEETVKRARDFLQKKHYKIREENGNIFAEKGRFSRWGPYVNHTGLIIVLIGAMLRFFPGMYLEESLWLREGQTKAIPGTGGEYYLKNNEFIVEVYNRNDERFKEAIAESGAEVIPKNFQTNVTLYQAGKETIPGAKNDLKKVKTAEIRVNEPLVFEDYRVYQVDYKLNELSKMSFFLENKKTGEKYGKITINLYEPKKVYRLGNGYKVELISYFPNFYFNKKGEPATKNDIPDNPAFIFKMYTPETPKGEISFVKIRQNLDIYGENKYQMTFAGFAVNDVTGLRIKKDHTLGIIALGGFIFLFGVVQGMYWNHRRMWLYRKKGELWLAATTNKNWYGLKREIEALCEAASLSLPNDRLEKRRK